MVKTVRARSKRKEIPFGGDLFHFWFQVGEQRLVYSYINKNACSAFKKFICETSPFYEKPLNAAQEISFLLEHHLVQFRSQLQERDLPIFVLRDPLDRFASTVVNKLVMRSGAKDLLANIRAISGTEPSELTVESLLERYVEPNLHSRNRSLSPIIDQHFLTQSQCLAPVLYHHAIPINQLNAAMELLIGPRLASEYFSRRSNRSAHVVYDEDSSRVPFAALWRRYEEEELVPSAKAFLSRKVRSMLARLYDVDFEMFRNLHA